MSMKKILKEMQELEERFLIDDPPPQALDATQPDQDLTKTQKKELKQTGNLLAKVIGKGVEQLQDLVDMMVSSGENLEEIFGEKATEKISEMGLKLKDMSEFFKTSNPLETPLENPLETSSEKNADEPEPMDVEPLDLEPEAEETEVEAPDEDEEPGDGEEESEEGEDEDDEEFEDDEEEDVKESVQLQEGFFEVLSDGKPVGSPTSFNAAKEMADKSSGVVEIRVYDNAKAHGGKLKRVLIKRKDQWVGKQ